MINDFEYGGYWYIQENPKNRLSGKLKFKGEKPANKTILMLTNHFITSVFRGRTCCVPK